MDCRKILVTQSENKDSGVWQKRQSAKSPESHSYVVVLVTSFNILALDWFRGFGNPTAQSTEKTAATTRVSVHPNRRQLGGGYSNLRLGWGQGRSDVISIARVYYLSFSRSKNSGNTVTPTVSVSRRAKSKLWTYWFNAAHLRLEYFFKPKGIWAVTDAAADRNDRVLWPPECCVVLLPLTVRRL